MDHNVHAVKDLFRKSACVGSQVKLWVSGGWRRSSAQGPDLMALGQQRCRERPADQSCGACDKPNLSFHP